MASKKKKKSMGSFVKEHRTLIDSIAASVSGTRERLNDEEREEWVNNDEGLLLLARAENVEGCEA